MEKSQPQKNLDFPKEPTVPEDMKNLSDYACNNPENAATLARKLIPNANER